MKKGQNVKVLIDYDLFDLNVNGLMGIYLKTDDNGKSLVYFPQNGEYGEFKEEEIEFQTGRIPNDNLEFVSRIKTMTVTFPT
tara:strand:- start:1692 stop:1937 length:246 start_codon:yes stop_codon:yes gene_type:complete